MLRHTFPSFQILLCGKRTRRLAIQRPRRNIVSTRRTWDNVATIIVCSFCPDSSFKNDRRFIAFSFASTFRKELLTISVPFYYLCRGGVPWKMHERRSAELLRAPSCQDGLRHVGVTIGDQRPDLEGVQQSRQEAPCRVHDARVETQLDRHIKHLQRVRRVWLKMELDLLRP